MFADSVSILEWSVLIFSKSYFRKLKAFSRHRRCCCPKGKFTVIETCLEYALTVYVKDCFNEEEALAGDILDPTPAHLFW